MYHAAIPFRFEYVCTRHATLCSSSLLIPMTWNPFPFTLPHLPLHLIGEEKRPSTMYVRPAAKLQKWTRQNRKTRESSLKRLGKRHNSINTIKDGKNKQLGIQTKTPSLPPFRSFLRGRRNGLYTMFSRAGGKFLQRQVQVHASKRSSEALQTMNFISPSLSLEKDQASNFKVQVL
jgi:hypothetical protein